MIELKGIIPYLVSPVYPKGGIKTDVLEKLCSDLARAGIHGLCVLGSSGEFPYLSLEEKKELVSTVVKVGHEHGLPVVSGVAGFSIAGAVREAEAFVSLGVDALILMIETYFPLSNAQLAFFTRKVADSVPDIPIVLYSNPEYMHYQFSLEFFYEIEDCRNVLYYKDASGNTGFLMTLTNEFGSRYKLFSASAHVPMFISELGGVGWMSGPACIIPREAVSLYELCQRQDYDKAIVLQRGIWKICRAFARYDLTACLKAVLNLQGYEVGEPVPPLAPLSREAALDVIRAIEELRALKGEEE